MKEMIIKNRIRKRETTYNKCNRELKKNERRNYPGGMVKEGGKVSSGLLQEAVKVEGAVSRGFSTDKENVLIWRTGVSKSSFFRESGAVAVKKMV